tara:strand:+ start:4386 stop:5141 length:756 start_codon:yes stop_codon:yes gene_type:complete
MTANEMAAELDQQVDRASSFGSPGYEDFEYSSVLTDAMNVYVKQFIDRKNNRKGESLEETEVRSQGLSALIKRGIALTVSADQTGTFTNGTFYDLPTDFMYTIHEDGTIDKKICTDGVTPISTTFNVIAHDEVSRLEKNKYKKPYYKTYGDAMTWRLVFSRVNDGYTDNTAQTAKRHQLVTDGTFNIERYSINYLQNPPNIVVNRTTAANQRNCILDDSTHLPIIDIAKSLLLERVQERELANMASSKDLE